MLPVAFTCPLWWVARWATRVLTSLAVVAALALGAGPVSAAAPPSTPTAAPSLSTAPGLSAAASAGAAEEALPAWSVDAQPALPDGQGALAAGVLPVRVTGSDRLPLVDGPHSRAPRGPPGR
ncbi:hypothetical protein ACQPWW_11085 [Micromonospora sp. CA-240977]|uniref:hypothetical protein n=1 Tax=Micromonospora sp. CA-240977 TaxID=3239957 RepID=UPI003D8D4E9C